MTAPRSLDRIVCLGIVALLVAGIARESLAGYVDEVLADNPVGYWRFEDVAGPQVTDWSAGASNGTINGGVTLGTAGVPGIGGNAGAFDGSTGYVQLPGTWGGTPAVTVEAWVNNAAPITGDFQAVVAATSSSFVHLQLHGSGSTGPYTNAGAAWVAPPSATPTDAWRHVVLVAESGNTRVYVNGVQLGEANPLSFGNVTTSSSVRIGSGWQGGRWFKGLIDEVAIYDTALSEERVLAHYQAVVPPPTLLAQWTFDDPLDGGKDETGNHPGSLQGLASITPDAKVGGGALDLRDVAGSMAIPTAVLNGETSMSMAYWISADSLTPGCCAGIFTSDVWASGATHVNLNTADGGKINPVVNGGASAISTDVLPTDGRWVHVAHTYDAAAGISKTYFNGVLNATATSTAGQPVSTGASHVGSWNASRYLDGRIDDMRVYSGVLTSNDVLQLAGFDPRLIGHWTFDDDANGGADSSFNANDGTLGGGAAITADAVIGDGALDLRDVDGYVDLPPGVLNGETSLTFAYWISADSLTNGCCQAVFANDGWTAGTLHVNHETPTARTAFAVAGVAVWGRTDPIPPDGDWVHVAFTYDAATGTTVPYVDGVAQTPVTSTIGQLIGTGGATIGAWNTDGAGNYDRFVDGRIDDLRIYNVVLSPEEIAGLAVPEPSSLILFSLGLLGLAAAVRRRFN